MEPILFTLDEANELIPFLNDHLARLKSVKAKIDSLIAAHAGDDINYEDLFRAESLPEDLQQLRRELEVMGDEVNDILFDIQEKGVFVKDIELGLVDFHCRLEGEIVCLCWKIGEPEIRYWHGTKEGFANRKSLFERRFLEQVTKLH